jgi:hypothetical protein
MYTEFKEMLLELVPNDHLFKDIQKLRKLALVAGLSVNLISRDESSYLLVSYCDEFTEFVRTRNAGRHRESVTVTKTCGDVCSLRREKGAKATAVALNMSLSTFYRHYLENMGKHNGEMFL